MSYIVLRAEERIGAFSLDDAAPPSFSAEKVEDRRNLSGDESVLSFAPIMPFRLHEPVARGDIGETAVALWGRNAVGLEKSPYTGKGVTVAVLDTGIDAQHEAFKHLQGSLLEKDFTGEGNGDKHGHGTHCAGTILGGEVNGQAIGIAPGIKKALVGKVIGSQGASSQSLVEGIHWALSEGANVISMSLGVDFPGYVQRLVKGKFPVDLATSKALDAYRENLDLFAALAEQTLHYRRPVLILAAAGNESRRDKDASHVIGVAPPAAARGFVAVGALGAGPGKFQIASFSNTGARVCGPGVDIVSARPGGGLTSMSGTSMATPHVAGVAALWLEHLWETHPKPTSQLLLDKLLGSASLRPIDRKSWIDAGNGLVQAPLREDG